MAKDGSIKNVYVNKEKILLKIIIMDTYKQGSLLLGDICLVICPILFSTHAMINFVETLYLNIES